MVLSAVHGFSNLKFLQVLLPLFSREGNGFTEKLNKLSKITWLKHCTSTVYTLFNCLVMNSLSFHFSEDVSLSCSVLGVFLLDIEISHLFSAKTLFHCFTGFVVSDEISTLICYLYSHVHFVFFSPLAALRISCFVFSNLSIMYFLLYLTLYLLCLGFAELLRSES